MNKEQRKRLQEAVDQLSTITDPEEVVGKMQEEVQHVLDMAQTTCDEVGTEERDKFDNMPEGLQVSPTGMKIEECADALEMITWPEVPADWKDEDTTNGFCGDVQTALDEIEGLL